MDRHKDPHSFVYGKDRTAIALDSCRSPGQSVRRRGAQSDNETRTYGLDLIKQPVSAYLYLTCVRAFVQPPFAPLLELEMLDSVRHIEALTVQACFNKRFIQQKPCRSDERSAFAVFSVPGLFANELTSAFGGPSPKTVCVASFQSGHAWQEAALRLNASSLLLASLFALPLTA